MFFNFHSSYRATETTLDGNVKDGKELTVRIRKGEAEPPLVKRWVPKKTFLSEHFPVWLGLNLPSFKPNRTYGFQTLMEDGVDQKFSPVNGTVRLEKADEVANKTKTTKLQIEINGVRSFWWVERSGMPVRTEMASQRMVVERATPEQAQAFLKGP